MNLDYKTLKVALKDSIPVMAGYCVLGLGYGIMMSNQGFTWLLTMLSSIFIFSGSLQYLQVDLLASGASLISCGLLTIMVNLRYMLYSITLVEKYRQQKGKLYCAFAAPDETYSLIMSKKDDGSIDINSYNLYLSIINQFYWVLFTTLGCLLGNILPFDTTGIDFAMTALFIVLFIEQWKQDNDHESAIIGLVSSIVWLFIVGADNFLIPTMITMIIIFMILKKVRGNK